MFRRSHRIKAYWWAARPNFGDGLAPLLLKRFAGIDTEWETISHSQVASIGSILEHIPPLWDGYILGSGRMYPDSHLHLYGSDLTVLALRGPLSKKAYHGDCALGDPGLLADELLPAQDRIYDLGIVPHWSDVELHQDPRFVGHTWSTLVINPSDDPLKVVGQIGQCKKIVSSSLHGLIVADAYGIPRRFEYTEQFDREGGLYKFEDYSASIGLTIEVGKLQYANQHYVEDRKHELWDAYRELGSLIGRR